VRARSLLEGLSPAGARARLSGELIGAELASARARVGAAPLALIGEGGLSARYEAALLRAGFAVERFEVEALTRAGLAAARETIRHA